MKQNYTNLLLILLLFVAASAKAQSDKVAISLGPEIAIPFNAEHDYYKVRDVYQLGAGASIKAEFPVSAEVKFTTTAGYMHYASNVHLLYLAALSSSHPYGGSSDTPPYQFIPVKAGFRYYYAKSFYLDADAGGAFKVGTGAENSFIYSGAIGALIPFSKHHGLDLNVRYESGYKNKDYHYAIQQLAIRLAYRFGF